MNNKFDENLDKDLDKDFDETKRKSLIKMGKSAVYVAPAVLTLLTSQKVSAISVPPSSGGGGHHGGGHHGGGHHGGGHHGGGHRRRRPWWKFW